MLVVFDVVPAEARRNSYFVMSETESENLKPFPKWTNVLKRFNEHSSNSDKECAKPHSSLCIVREWKDLLASLKGKPAREQIEQVNDWGNKHSYIIDQLNWGMEDYWETPHEFISINGDCEDYAIAKYYSLRALGFKEEQLRIIILQDFNLGGIIHAVLAVYDKGEMLILDNQSTEVTPALKIYHYRPIYGVNRNHWWAYTPKT